MRAQLMEHHSLLSSQALQKGSFRSISTHAPIRVHAGALVEEVLRGLDAIENDNMGAERLEVQDVGA